MSYIFSQALVEEYSPASFSDTDASAPSNTSPTPKPCLWHDRTMEPSRLSRFGMTCERLMDDRGEALLMSFVEASRARTSAQQEEERESMASAPASGAKWPALSVKYDPVSSSWKTAHCLWEEDLPWCSVTLPKWGMTRSGSVYQHPTAERPISETGRGYWPTPCKTDGMIGWSETVVKNRERTGFRPSGARIGYQLNYVRKTQAYVMESGLYHPNLSEWLLGWPLGWTDLQPLETDRYQEWLRQHSPFFQGKNKEQAA